MTTRRLGMGVDLREPEQSAQVARANAQADLRSDARLDRVAALTPRGRGPHLRSAASLCPSGRPLQGHRGKLWHVNIMHTVSDSFYIALALSAHSSRSSLRAPPVLRTQKQHDRRGVDAAVCRPLAVRPSCNGEPA